MTQTPDNPLPFPPFGVHKRAHVYQSPWCNLRRDEVILPSGKLQEYHVFEIGPATVVVPVLKDGRVVMVGQYRYPHGKTHWELPAGRLNAGEDPATAAHRELLEETGHKAGRMQELPGFYPTNGISDHFAHPFIAHDCEWVQEPELEEAEQLMVRIFTRSEVEALLDDGRIEDGFAAIALMYWLRTSD